MLYFQEGIMCQPCWDQLKDLEAQRSELGVDQIATITTDPLDASRQKAADEGLTTPVLSDQNLAVSSAYTTNRYGMMGTSANGHSFIVVRPDGKIERRLDYGGAPDYTMYVPGGPDLSGQQGPLVRRGARAAEQAGVLLPPGLRLDGSPFRTDGSLSESSGESSSAAGRR